MSLKNRVSLYILLLLGCGEIFAQDVIPTKGKEFWVGFMQNYVTESSESLNLFITSDQNTTGTVTVPLQGWSVNFTVNADQTTTVTIPNNIGEHYNTSEIVENRGIFVETQDTVAVFAINFNPFTADGTKILPVKSLGTRYRISSYAGISGHPSEFLIVATEDGTEVQITPTAATQGGNPANVPFTVQLDAGESYQVKATSGDFTGTVIEGTEASGDCRPFAMFSGVSCVNVPVGCFACDHIYEQAFPTDTWGQVFYVVPFLGTTSYTYRVLADEDNTTVTINGGATVNLNAGQFYEANSVSTVTCVSADKPISVIQYMQGADCSGGNGDPAMLILNDESQKIDNITFSTVESTVITDHSLNVVIESTDIGSLTLDGNPVAPASFNAFPNCPSHSYAQLPIPAGSHTLDAPNGFSAYVYGTGGYETYAYSVGSFRILPSIIANVDSVICSADTVLLVAEAGLSNIIWYAQSDPETILGTGQSFQMNPPLISDIYVAAGEQFVSGCVTEELWSIEVPDPPTLEIGTEHITICKYQSAQLNVATDPISPTYQYSWTPSTGLNNPGIANPVATPLESTWYYITVSTPSGCGIANDSLFVEVVDGAITGFEAVSDVEIFCIGGEANLDALLQEIVFEDNFDPGISWGLWSNIANGIESNACGSLSGLALYFNGTGVRSATTIDLDVSTGGTINFALKVGSGTAPCDNADAGEDIILEYSTDGGGAWDPVQTFFEFAYPSFVEISVDIPTDAETASTRFRWRQLSNSGNNQDNWSLDNVFIGTNNQTDYTFNWTPDYQLSATNIANPAATPLVDTMYYVEVFDPIYGCTYTDSIFIEVGQGFNVALMPDTIICDLQGIQLEAVPDIAGNFEYTWTPDDGTISNPSVFNPIVTPQATTTYHVDVLSEEGCANEAEVTITVNQLLDLDASTDNNNFCAGGQAQLDAVVAGNPSGLSFEWSPADYLSDSGIPNPVATPDTHVTYEVTVTDTLSGCILTETVELLVYEAFQVIASNDTSLCNVTGFQLEASVTTLNPVDWEWEPAGLLNNANLPNPTITGTEGALFTVTATDDGGCAYSDTVEVILLFESFDLGPDLDICVGDEVILSTGYGPEFEHDWSTGESTHEITVSTAGNYSVTVTSDQGCSDTDAINVVVHELPVVDLGPDQSLCVGDFWVMDAANPGADFIWSNGETTQAILTTISDTYSVTVTDSWSCENSDEIEVIFHENPSLELPDQTTICVDEFLDLDAGNSGSVYTWSTGEDTQVITVNTEGLYWVEITNEFNCSSRDSSELFIAFYPEVDLGPDQAFCAGESYVLNAGNPDLNINWSTGANTQEITVAQTGIYSVTVDNNYCFSTDQATILFYPLPDDPLPNDTILCFDNSSNYQLNAGNSGSLFEWSTGATTQVIPLEAAGVYWVDITTSVGCNYRDTIYVDEFCAGDLFWVPNAFSPNSDGINEAFYVVAPNAVAFEMTIFNRWGQKIFETTDINEAWQGNMRDGDHYVDSEVYVWVIRYKYLMDAYGTASDWVEKTGHVTLIR